MGKQHSTKWHFSTYTYYLTGWQKWDRVKSSNKHYWQILNSRTALSLSRVNYYTYGRAENILPNVETLSLIVWRKDAGNNRRSKWSNGRCETCRVQCLLFLVFTAVTFSLIRSTETNTDGWGSICAMCPSILHDVNMWEVCWNCKNNRLQQ